MIEKLVVNKKSKLTDLLHFVEGLKDSDFYYTKDNQRLYVTDINSLKGFLRDSSQVYVCKDARGDYQGILLVWKSIGGGQTRYYVKVNAVSSKIATDLLTILTWNFNRQLFVKIRKDSKLIEGFKFKGFRFEGSRGTQLLLKRDKSPYEFKTYQKEADIE